MIIGKEGSSVSTVMEIEWRRWLPRMRWRWRWSWAIREWVLWEEENGWSQFLSWPGWGMGYSRLEIWIKRKGKKDIGHWTLDIGREIFFLNFFFKTCCISSYVCTYIQGINPPLFIFIQSINYNLLMQYNKLLKISS